MAWRRSGDKPLSEPMVVRLPTHICVTRPQCVNNIPALVQIMAWHHPGNEPLSEPMVASLTMDLCITWPQWVDKWFVFGFYFSWRSTSWSRNCVRARCDLIVWRWRRQRYNSEWRPNQDSVHTACPLMKEQVGTIPLSTHCFSIGAATLRFSIPALLF